MIVIPMVGLSRRFFDAGYALPKYQLTLNGRTVFEHAVRSFERYFKTDHFRFLVRSDYGAPAFVDGAARAMGIDDFKIVTFASDTRGQAETVYLGCQHTDAEQPIYIFNIDTFRPGFEKPAFAAACDGYLEVFRGEGEHWSFVEPHGDESGRVLRTTEKERISDLCSDGLYYFRRKADFDAAFEAALAQSETTKGEFYVAPLYNRLIAGGADIRYDLVDIGQIRFCGTPAEYRALLDA